MRYGCIAVTLVLVSCAGSGRDIGAPHQPDNTPEANAAQSVDSGVLIVAAGVSYLIPRVRREWEGRSDVDVVLDPTLVEGRFGAGPIDFARAEKVRELAPVKRLATIQETLRCPDAGACRLAADVVFRFGTPIIQDDRATVNVIVWWAGNPEWRDPTPVTGIELTLVRTGNIWEVIEDRTLWLS
jgi:hypothetical protein